MIHGQVASVFWLRRNGRNSIFLVGVPWLVVGWIFDARNAFKGSMNDQENSLTKDLLIHIQLTMATKKDMIR